MTKEEALRFQKEIEALCRKHGVWLIIEHEKKPDLKMIRIKEASVKIDQP